MVNPSPQQAVRGRASPVHLGIAVVASLALAAGLAVAGSTIYKTIDANGNVVYTDVAPANSDSNAALKVTELNTFESPAPAAPQAGLPSYRGNDNDGEDEAIPAYTALSMLTPLDDQAIRANNGSVVLSASVSPDLHPSHKLRFFLDGAPAGTVNGLSLPLVNVDRGSHQAKVAIMDEEGNPIRESAAVNFHVQRVSIQHPNAPHRNLNRPVTTPRTRTTSP